MSTAASTKESVARQPSPKLVWQTFLCFCCASTCALGVAGTLASLDPVFELATHCFMHCWVASLVVLPLAILSRMPRSAGFALVALVISGYFVQPWMLWTGEAKSDPAFTDELCVLSWNLLVSNHSSEEIEAVIRDVDPDVLVLIELRHGFSDEIAYLNESFPYRREFPSWGGEGIGVYSKVPNTEFQLEDFGYEFQPAIVARIPGSRGQTLELVGLHALSPLPRYRSKIRDGQIQSMVQWAKERPAVCVCGDLNTTPWTPAFREMVQAGFRDSRMGTGNCVSWPRPLGPLGIPIDHALSKGDCQIFDRRVLPEAPGSDHHPITFRLRY